MCAGATVFDREVACLRSNAELIGSVSIADGNSNYQTLTQPAQSNSREIENWAATGFRTHCGKNHSRMGLGLRATRKLAKDDAGPKSGWRRSPLISPKPVYQD